MQKEFIKLEINIPSNDIIDLITEIAHKLNSQSKNNNNNNTNTQPIILNKKVDNKLLTVSEVSNILKINTDSVYSLIKTGHLKALKLRSLKVTSSELERFIKWAEGKDFTDLNNVKELEFN